MGASDREGWLTHGVDYELARWTTGETDAEGKLIWHETLPDNDQWKDITIVTLDYDPDGEGLYRNIRVSPLDEHGKPIEPLDPYARPDLAKYGPDYFFDLDDLASQYDWDKDTPG